MAEDEQSLIGRSLVAHQCASALGKSAPLWSEENRSAPGRGAKLDPFVLEGWAGKIVLH